jgi:uridine phosphorylase
MRIDREKYLSFYLTRSAKAWAPPHDSQAYAIDTWSRRILMIASGPEYTAHIANLLDQVEIRENIEVWSRTRQITENLGGYYHGQKVTILHTIVTPYGLGASYVDYAMERLRRTLDSTIILIGESSGLHHSVRTGDLLIPLSLIKGDDSHRSYAEPDIPALSDGILSRKLFKTAATSGRKVHIGTCWSCGAGAGIYDPYLAGKAWELHSQGVLGNTLEAATAYLIADLMDFHMSSLWLVADSIYEPIGWSSPFKRMGWEDGWDALVKAALDTLVETKE